MTCFWKMFFFREKRLAFPPFFKRERISFKTKSKKQKMERFFMKFRFCQDLIFLREVKRGNKGEASNSCQVPVCMSMICVLFPFVSFFSRTFPLTEYPFQGLLLQMFLKLISP